MHRPNFAPIRREESPLAGLGVPGKKMDLAKKTLKPVEEESGCKKMKEGCLYSQNLLMRRDYCLTPENRCTIANNKETITQLNSSRMTYFSEDIKKLRGSQ